MDDLISRQAAIYALKRAEALTRAFGYHNVIETIREVSSAQPERKKGKWIICTEECDETFHTGSRCSVCNYWKPMGIWNYCPNCGADMRGEQDE